MTTSSHITDNNNDGDKDGCDADVVDNTNTAGKTSITTSSDASCSGCSSVEADGSDETSSDDDVINDLDQLDIICTIGKIFLLLIIIRTGWLADFAPFVFIE